MRLKTLSALAASAIAAALWFGPAQAAFPEKPVTIVVPFPPGGPTDTLTRIVAAELTERMGQNFIVENRPGAAGIVGSETVAKANPDGYTLLLAASTHAINPAIHKNIPYDTEAAFDPVSLAVSAPFVLAVHPTVPANSVQELIDYLKSKPGEINYASASIGSGNHLSAEMFQAQTGVKIEHVPYQGASPALKDLVAGHVEMMFGPMLTTLPLAKENQVRALAVTSPERSPSAPDLPAMAETVPGFNAMTWYGFVAPAGTPEDVVATLSDQIGQIIKTPSVVERVKSLGGAPVGSSPAEFRTFIHDQIALWGAAAKRAGVEPK